MNPSDKIKSGSKISVDHFEANPRGCLQHTYGKEKADLRYKGGCIFVDHASGYIHVELQVRLNTTKTKHSKNLFELMCSMNGVVPHGKAQATFTNFWAPTFHKGRELHQLPLVKYR